ncbi:hypothetical protein XENTR_v10020432 [Xenopus tropicalis]|nr:hypothetical protein XENTR_v10020432 [Xenopus tropicalis]
MLKLRYSHSSMHCHGNSNRGAIVQTQYGTSISHLHGDLCRIIIIIDNTNINMLDLIPYFMTGSLHNI